MTFTLQDLVSNEAMQSLIKDLGIENDAPEDQIEIMMMIGSNVTKRLILAFITRLPEDTHTEFESYLGSNNTEGLLIFLEKHIPDLNQLIMDEAKQEFEETLAEADRQG